MVIGLFRIKAGWIDEDSVRVRYPTGKELEIPASQYLAFSHTPPLQDLEWGSEADHEYKSKSDGS